VIEVQLRAAVIKLLKNPGEVCAASLALASSQGTVSEHFFSLSYKNRTEQIYIRYSQYFSTQ